MKPYVKIALFVVLFIAVSAILTALVLYNKKHPDTAKVKPDFIITATLLQKEFEDNEAKASAIYINKILEVTGTIVSVTPTDSSHLNISLKTGSDISSVICAFPAINDPSKFKTGEEVTLRGECSGFLMDVLLKNCAIIPMRK
jgi:tRNA_anti-like